MLTHAALRPGDRPSFRCSTVVCSTCRRQLHRNFKLCFYHTERAGKNQSPIFGIDVQFIDERHENIFQFVGALLV